MREQRLFRTIDTEPRPFERGGGRPAWARPTARPPAARVMIFVHDLSTTGVVRNAVRIANRLQRDGHAVDLVASRAEGMMRGAVGPGVRVTGLLDGGDAGRAAELARTLPRLRALLRERAPAVLLSAGNHGHLLCCAASLGMPGVRRIYRLSNDFGQDRRDAGSATRLRSGLRRAAFAPVAASAWRLAPVSPHLLAEPRIAAARADGRVALIPNGVDVAEVRRRAEAPCPHPWLQGDGAPTLVAIGRLVAQKNFETLIAALGLANRERALRLVVLGAGGDGARARLLALAAAHGVADRVDFAGAVPNPFAYLSRAAAFVLPSWWEGASNALLEAVACGAPVVASRTAGNARDVLDDGRYGVLVDPGDAEAMAAAILRQTGEDPLRPGDRAAAFDVEHTVDAYAALVAEAVQVPSS